MDDLISRAAAIAEVEQWAEHGHEMLHLKTCLVSDKVDPLQERYMHPIISDLSRAFVDAKRMGVRA